MMSFGFDLFHHMGNSTIFADNKGGTQYAHKLTTHKFLKAPGTVFIGNCMIFIAEQSEIELLLVFKFYQPIHRIWADC